MASFLSCNFGAPAFRIVEILPGTIRFTDAKTKQALVFQKTAGDKATR